jgi:hypothetical protein
MIVDMNESTNKAFTNKKSFIKPDVKLDEENVL